MDRGVQQSNMSSANVTNWGPFGGSLDSMPFKMIPFVGNLKQTMPPVPDSLGLCRVLSWPPETRVVGRRHSNESVGRTNLFLSGFRQPVQQETQAATEGVFGPSVKRETRAAWGCRWIGIPPKSCGSDGGMFVIPCHHHCRMVPVLIPVIPMSGRSKNSRWFTIKLGVIHMDLPLVYISVVSCWKKSTATVATWDLWLKPIRNEDKPSTFQASTTKNTTGWNLNCHTTWQQNVVKYFGGWWQVVVPALICRFGFTFVSNKLNQILFIPLWLWYQQIVSLLSCWFIPSLIYPTKQPILCLSLLLVPLIKQLFQSSSLSIDLSHFCCLYQLCRVHWGTLTTHYILYIPYHHWCQQTHSIAALPSCTPVMFGYPIRVIFGYQTEMW